MSTSMRAEDSVYSQRSNTVVDLLDLMPWRRRCSPRALAAQVVNTVVKMQN